MVNKHTKTKYDLLLEAIEKDDINFLEKNFVDTIKHFFDFVDHDRMVELLKLASKNNSNNIIKFLLTDGGNIASFGEIIYTKSDVRDLLKYSINNNNTDIISFICQSNQLNHYISLESINLVNLIDFIKINNDTIDFIKNYNNDLVRIEEKFLYMEEAFRTMPFNKSIIILKDLLISDYMVNYSKTMKEKLEEFFYFSFTINHSELTQFLLSNTVQSDIFITYKNICNYDCPDSLKLLIEHMYVQYNKNSDKVFNLSEGLINAITSKHNKLVDIILNQPYDNIEFNLLRSFQAALFSNNFEVIPLLINKSLKTDPILNTISSVIIDQYPYHDSNNLIISLTEEHNLITAFNYIASCTQLNPSSYRNYSANKINFYNNTDSLVTQLFNKGYTKALSSIIDNPYYNIQPSFFNENLIKNLIDINYVHDMDNSKKMIDYLMNNFPIERTNDFHNYLQEIIKLPSSNKSSSVRGRIAQHILDYYDSFLFNEKLLEKINDNNIVKKQKKNKV